MCIIAAIQMMIFFGASSAWAIIEIEAPPPPPSSVSAPKNRCIYWSQLIHPQNYDRNLSNWTEYGPHYEGNKQIGNFGGRYLHAYGKSVGRMVYMHKINPRRIDTLKISARLSSEFPGYGQQTPANGYSDVTLFVNGKNAGIQRIVPDDGAGKRYVWDVDPDWIEENNKIEFVVLSDAKFRNGLAIYSEPVAEFQAREFIEIIGTPCVSR